LVPDSAAGERLDTFLARVTGESRSTIIDWIAEGLISVDGRPSAKSKQLSPGQVISVSAQVPLESKNSPAQQLSDNDEQASIVDVTSDFVVVDKPAGLAAHPSVGWAGSDVLASLQKQGISIATSGAAERQGVVQRLDVGTSGLMVIARTEIAYSRLKQQFRNREVEKTYHAVVQGHPDPLAATLDAPIARSKRHDYKFVVDAAGKPAVTHYETLELMPRAALLEVKLETGRTHQIRVHFSTFNHPLVGDPVYGSDPKLAAELGLGRQWLHAVGLAFRHPTSGEWISFQSEYPEDLRIALERLRNP
jgi:23S rRNA pseudouridine1911/1915/1917 synthase